MSAHPTHSLAAVLRRFGEPLVLEEVPVPGELAPGAMLVRIEVCSVCGTDVHLWQGEISRKVDLPVIIGHEMMGRIVAMGSGCDRDSIGQPLRTGDRVVWTHTVCGNCFYCTVARQPTLCEYSRRYMHENIESFPYLMGGFSQYCYVFPDSGRVRVPDNVPDELASMSSCAFRSVMKAMDELGPIAATETVVIQGAGPLGLLATAAAKVAGARQIIVIGAPDARLSLAKDFGADVCITIEDTPHSERLRQVQGLTSGRGADVVMEFTGHAAAIPEGLDLVRRGGRYLVVGQAGIGEVTISPTVIVRKNLRIIGSLSGTARDYWKALEFVSIHQHSFPFHRMLTNKFKLAEVNIALERMKNLQEVKPLIEVWKV